MSNKQPCWSVGVLLVTLLAFVPPNVHAQSEDTQAGEIGGQVGFGFGGSAHGIGTQPSVTGSTGVAFSKYGMVLVEAAFMPLGQDTIQGWPAPSTVRRSYLIDFGIDFHIRIPLRARWAPYMIAGTGLLWNMIRQETANAASGSTFRAYDQFNGALHTGGGLRYYIRDKWGIRPEVKVIVSKQVYTSVSVGIFYVVPADWP